MLRAKEARQEAREALSGKWKKAFLISLVYMIFTMLIGLLGALLGPISFLVSIAEIVILPPLTYGMAYSYYHLKNGEEVSYFDFLKVGFGNFKRSWGIAWRIFCKCWYLILIPVIFMIVILIIGFSIITATSSTLSEKPMKEQYLKASYSSTPYSDYYDYYDNYSDYLDDYDYDYNYDYNYDKDYNYNKDSKDSSISNSEVLQSIGVILGASAGLMLLAIGLLAIYILILVIVIRKVLLYALSYYIAVANEGITPKDAVQESENLMKGNRGRLFCLILSFIGWALLVGIVEGALYIIPAIGWLFAFIASAVGTSLLSPYVTFAILAFYRDLKGENNINSYINNYQNQNAPVIGGNNIQSTNNGYQAYTNQIVNNGNPTNVNSVVNNGSPSNVNPVVNNGYQINTNPVINNDNNVNPIGIHNTTAQINATGKKYCKRCGAENTLDATYCTNCGAKLD